MKKDLKIITLALILIVSVSCNKSYFDINTNPNKAASATPELVLANALVSAASPVIGGSPAISAWMGYWAPSGSYAQNAQDFASYFQAPNITGYGNWGTYYKNLEDLEYVRTQAIAQNKPFYQGAAMILQALDFQELVDQFNNVPFSTALQGTTNIQPTYDKAQTIYETLSTNLGTAVTLMQNPSASSSATSDVLFGGVAASPGLWAKFANTLRLRILMHQSQMAGRATYIQGEIAKITANNAGFLTVDAAVKAGYNNNTGQQSPFWGLCINTAGTYILDYWRANKYIIDFCTNTANNDPRYMYWYAPAATGGYVGNVLGGANVTVNAVGSGSSTFGPGVLKSVNQPAVLLSAAESYFLQAEASLYGWLGGSANTLFNNGVAASFNYLGATLGNYTSQAGNVQTNFAACTGTVQQLACIIRQKYLAMNMVTPMEAWSDYRRLGLPANVPISSSIYRVGTTIPNRFVYPQSEYNTNQTNVAAQGTIDGQVAKIFWQP